MAAALESRVKALERNQKILGELSAKNDEQISRQKAKDEMALFVRKGLLTTMKASVLRIQEQQTKSRQKKTAEPSDEDEDDEDEEGEDMSAKKKKKKASTGGDGSAASTPRGGAADEKMKPKKEKQEKGKAKTETLKTALAHDVKEHFKALMRKDTASEDQKEVVTALYALHPEKCLGTAYLQSEHEDENGPYGIFIWGMKHTTEGAALHELLEFDVQLVTAHKKSEISIRQNFPGRDGGALRKAAWKMSGKDLPSAKAKAKAKTEPKKRGA